MLILGINGGAKREDEDNRQSFAFHDSAALLIKDGKIQDRTRPKISQAKKFPHFHSRETFCLGRSRHLADNNRVLTAL